MKQNIVLMVAMDPQQSDNSGEDSAIRSSGNAGFRDRQGPPVNDERIGVCHLQRKAQIVCSGTCKKLYRFLRQPQIFPTRHKLRAKLEGQILKVKT